MSTSRDRPRCVGSAPWLACRSLTRTVRYYREILGFQGSWCWTWGNPPDHAGLSRGLTRLMFFENPERAERFRGMEVVVYVEGVDGLFFEFQASGARIHRELGDRPWGTRDFTVEDPDGVHVVFTEAPEGRTDLI